MSASTVAASGNSQQRLGEAHQRHTFLVGEAELLEKNVEHAVLAATRTHLFYQLRGGVFDRRALGSGKTQARRQRDHARVFGRELRVANGPSQLLQYHTHLMPNRVNVFPGATFVQRNGGHW